MGSASLFDQERLSSLARRFSDLEILQAIDLLLSKVKLSDLVTRGPMGFRKLSDPFTRAFQTNFVEAVERALHQEGGGLEFAVATVLSRYQEAIEIDPPKGSGGMLQGLAELAESVLRALIAGRSQGETTQRLYVALAPSLTLAQAMTLKPGLVGLVLGEGVDREIATAARLLKVPAIVGVPNVSEFTREGDVVRVNGDAGTIEIIARLVKRVTRVQ